MKAHIPAAAAVVLMVATAIVQGRWSERWSPPPQLQLFADQLENVPVQIGDWRGEKTEEVDPRMLDVAGAVGSMSRVYRNHQGDVVSVFLVCGRLRDVFLHTPDHCYPAAGFQMAGEPALRKVETAAGPAEFYTTAFVKTTPTGRQGLQIFWSWCGDGDWEAPEDPRWTFAGHRAIYKLYVLAPVSRDPSAASPSTDFMSLLIPELQKSLAPAIKAS